MKNEKKQKQSSKKKITGKRKREQKQHCGALEQRIKERKKRRENDPMGYHTPYLSDKSLVKDYYRILGLARFSTLKDVRRAYKTLARLCHPDKNQGDEEAASRFKDIQEAYEALNTVQKRMHYDRRVYFDNILWDFLTGDEETHKQFNKNVNIIGDCSDKQVWYPTDFATHTIEMTREMNISDTVEGTLEIEYKRLCRTCESVGKIKPESGALDTAVCNACAGEGVIKEIFYGLGKATDQTKELRCIKCWGLGIVSNAEICGTCKGTTFEPVTEIKTVPFKFNTRIRTNRGKNNRVKTIKVYAGKEYAPVYVRLINSAAKEKEEENKKNPQEGRTKHFEHTGE